MPHTLFRQSHRPSHRFEVNRRDFHHLPKSGRIPDDGADDIHPISRDRISPHAHGGSPKKDRQNLSRTPKSDITDLHPGRRGFPMVADSRNREVELFSPGIHRRRDRECRVNFVGCLRLSEFCLQLNAAHGNTDSLRRRSHAIDGPPIFFTAFFSLFRTLACLLCEIKATIPHMLTSSFIFLPGVGPATECRWWQDGVIDGRDFLARSSVAGLSEHRKTWYDEKLREAQSLTEKRHFHMFGSRLPRREHGRLYDTCRCRVGSLDIETTGASPEWGEVTVVGLHREETTISLVRGENLTTERLQTELDHCDLLVTFFGSAFDIPYLHAKFPDLRFPALHFDLCFASRRLTLRGGLRHIEQEMGIDRSSTITGLNGLDAVHLWFQWCRGDTIAREILMSYNRADTENLVLLADSFYENLVSRFGPSSLPTTLQPAFSQ